MDELVIKEHNFVTAKNKIQEYVSKAPTDISLPRVREDGGFLNWGDHKVTGTEFNQCVGQVQKSLISLNGLTKTIISEFKEVYKAFEALDKDYISGIVIAVNAAKKASDDAKKVSDQNKKTIEALQKTVEKLRGFENEVRTDISALKAKDDLKGVKSIQHFDDIDSIWEDVHIHQGILSDINNQINSLHGALSVINQFKDALNELHHLSDIDSLWSDLQNHYASYKGFYDACIEFRNKVDADTSVINTSLDDIIKFRHSLESQLHIHDIDLIWDEIHEHYNRYEEFCKSYQEYKAQAGQFTKNLESQIFRLNEYKNLLESYCHLKDVDEIWSDLQLQKTEIGNQKQSIDGLSVAFRHSVDGLSDQIKDVSKRIDQFFEETDATIAHIRGEVKSLADYSDKLKSYGHLSEIDTIWEDLDGLKTKHNEFRKDYELFSDCMTSSFSSLSENVGGISSEVTRHHDKLSAIDSELKAIKDKIDSEQLKLSRRVRVNHIIAALSIVLIITLFVLDILKVI